MSIEMYFINDTKKQIVSTKKLYGDFEDKQQLLCYLNMCQGDNFRTEFEDSECIYDAEYKHIKLHEFNIGLEDDLYKSIEFERLFKLVTE